MFLVDPEEVEAFRINSRGVEGWSLSTRRFGFGFNTALTRTEPGGVSRDG